jgi:uncharacterized membrane protein
MYGKLSVCVIALSTSAAPPKAHGDSSPRYRLVDLGTLPGGDYSSAYAINNLGQVVGLSSTGKALIHGMLRDTRAVLWDSGGAHDLVGNSAVFPAAFAINDSGEILIRPQLIGGPHPGSVPPPTPYVIVWKGSTLRTWRTGMGFLPNAVDSHGVLVGHSETTKDVACMNHGGSTKAIPIPFRNQRSVAWSLNDSGMVGGCFQNGTNTRGFVYADGRAYDPTPWADEAFQGFTAVNKLGQAAEAARDKNWVTHLVLWDKGRTTELGLLGHYGQVTGMNSHDEIVGDRTGKPFIYLAGRIYSPSQLLEKDSPEIVSVTGINESGQISANADFAGQFRAVRLDPVL